MARNKVFVEFSDENEIRQWNKAGTIKCKKFGSDQEVIIKNGVNTIIVGDGYFNVTKQAK